MEMQCRDLLQTSKGSAVFGSEAGAAECKLELLKVKNDLSAFYSYLLPVFAETWNSLQA